jgi:hypothetical protein
MAGIRPTGSGPTGYPLQLGPTWGNSWPLSTVGAGMAAPYVPGVAGVAVFPYPQGNQKDFPNPRGKPWESKVRTGWDWQTPTALYSATYNYASSSKFIGYAILIPIPYNVQRVFELPPPIPPGKWNFNRRWESGPPLPLLTTPYHPFGAQEFPTRFPLPKRQSFEYGFLPSLFPLSFPVGSHEFPTHFQQKRTKGWTQSGIRTIKDDGFVYLICYE